MERIKLETTAVGIDIGSTTAKLVIIKDGAVVYERYERHYSRVRIKTLELLKDASEYLEGETFSVAISGLGGARTCARRGYSLRSGGFCDLGDRKKARPRHLRGHRAGRRGRQDNFLRGRHRRENERHLCRRYGRVHRSDGDAPRCVRLRA